MPREIGKYRLEIEYPVGTDEGVHDQIRKILNKKEWASGSGFGFRDLSFDYPTQAKLDDAIARLKANKIEGVEFRTYISEDD